MPGGDVGEVPDLRPDTVGRGVQARAFADDASAHAVSFVRVNVNVF
jgi:hypothetical protein